MIFTVLRENTDDIFHKSYILVTIRDIPIRSKNNKSYILDIERTIYKKVVSYKKSFTLVSYFKPEFTSTFNIIEIENLFKYIYVYTKNVSLIYNDQNISLSKKTNDIDYSNLSILSDETKHTVIYEDDILTASYIYSNPSWIFINSKPYLPLIEFIDKIIPLKEGKIKTTISSGLLIDIIGIDNINDIFNNRKLVDRLSDCIYFF